LRHFAKIRFHVIGVEDQTWRWKIVNVHLAGPPVVLAVYVIGYPAYQRP
jgi:hypothetical protein